MTHLLHHLPFALLVVIRIGGMMVYSPVIGSSIIPVRVKILLGFVVGAATSLALAERSETPPIVLDLWILAPLAALEALVGLSIGFLASLPLMGLQAGGVIIGQQIGFGFAQLFNPAMDEESDVIAQLLYFFAIAVFLAAGGLDAMMLTMLHSFERLPVGSASGILSAEALAIAAGLLISAMELGLRVAAPLLALVFLETTTLGFLSKTVPQMNILSLGFPLRILLGLGVLALGSTVMSDVLVEEIDHVFSLMRGALLTP